MISDGERKDIEEIATQAALKIINQQRLQVGENSGDHATTDGEYPDSPPQTAIICEESQNG